MRWLTFPYGSHANIACECCDSVVLDVRDLQNDLLFKMLVLTKCAHKKLQQAKTCHIHY